MEKINNEADLQRRYQRLRNVIERLEQRERQYAIEVLTKFNDLDIEAIEVLAQQKQKNYRLKERLQRFLDYYEHKRW